MKLDPVDTAVLRRFADRYEANVRRDLRQAGLPSEGDMPGPADLIRAACDELDTRRGIDRVAVQSTRQGLADALKDIPPEVLLRAGIV